jgi:hypothetical protein
MALNEASMIWQSLHAGPQLNLPIFTFSSAMKVNHLNLTVADPVQTQQFLVKYFGLKPRGKGNHVIALLSDDRSVDGKASVHSPQLSRCYYSISSGRWHPATKYCPSSGPPSPSVRSLDC